MKAASLFVLCGSLFALAGYTKAFTFTSSGAGGDTCGPNVCLTDDAVCADPATGQCVCSEDDTAGDGQILCHASTAFSIGSTNDPFIQIYDGRHVNLPLPCEYSLTKFSSTLLGRQNVNLGSCLFEMDVMNRRSRGKFYLHGIKVKLQLQYSATAQRNSFEFIAEGTANNGVYEYIVTVLDGGDDEIKFNDRTNNVKVELVRDLDNNMVVFKARRCGIRIHFRAYDFILRRAQPSTPGAAMSLDRSVDDLIFSDTEKAMALVPTADDNGIALSSLQFYDLSPSDAMIYRAINSLTPRVIGSEVDPCGQATIAYSRCADEESSENAVINCNWILKTPLFVNCYETTALGSNTIILYRWCVDVFCGRSVTCAEVQGNITAANCDSMVPNSFLTNMCDVTPVS